MLPAYLANLVTSGTLSVPQAEQTWAAQLPEYLKALVTAGTLSCAQAHAVLEKGNKAPEEHKLEVSNTVLVKTGTVSSKPEIDATTGKRPPPCTPLR